MGKYLITGRPGTGKSTTIRELHTRGFTAYNTDELDGVTQLEDKLTGAAITWPDGPVDWDRYAWNWQAAALKKLLASDETVFIGAITGNQAAFYPLFDTVFVLTLHPELLRQRLETHEHERAPEEKDRLIAHHAAKQALLLANGAVPLSSMQPVSAVVDQIISSLRQFTAVRH